MRPNMSLSQRKARLDDLPCIIELLRDDVFGALRESKDEQIYKNYENAFSRINSDLNQYLMIVEYESKIVATCHFTIMPSLTS